MGFAVRVIGRIPSARKEKNMLQFGTTELLIVLVIVVLLFGAGRIGKIANELGTSIRTFREGLSGEKEEKS